jgi:hypothetical protein
MENVPDEQMHLQNVLGYVLPVGVESTGWSIPLIHATCAEQQDVMKFDEEAIFISIFPVIRIVTPRPKRHFIFQPVISFSALILSVAD